MKTLVGEEKEERDLKDRCSQGISGLKSIQECDWHAEHLHHDTEQSSMTIPMHTLPRL